jgi:hypothetical protein
MLYMQGTYVANAGGILAPKRHVRINVADYSSVERVSAFLNKKPLLDGRGLPQPA